MKNTEIDVIIPVYKPGAEFAELLRRLRSQKVKIRNIYLMHTKDGNALMHSEALNGYDNIIIEEIEPEEFNHGGTRHKGFCMSDAGYVLFLTQDALPADAHLTERLLACMDDPMVAAAYGRQIPRRDCGLLERYVRQFNYPKESMVKSKEDLGRMGIKAYFCSNVCAMYRREIYEELGGFAAHTIFNEDMIYAAGCIQRGYKIAYAAEAGVIHSHNYTNMQQFRRNFDLAVSQAQRPEIFAGISSESEGIRMVKGAATYLLKSGKPWMLLELVLSSAAKYLGYSVGKRYQKLPGRMIEKCTMNPRYWKNACGKTGKRGK